MSLRDYWIPGSPPRAEDVVGVRAEVGACSDLGCMGPFANHVYQRGLGEGMTFADCMECGRRVLIRQNERGFESIGRFIEAFIPPAAQS